MELLPKSLSSLSVPGWLPRRPVLTGVGILVAAASSLSRARAQPSPSNLKFSNPKGMRKPVGYSQVVEMTGPGRMIYIAGQTGWDSSGKRAGEPGDFRAQATQVFENLNTALRSAGAGFEHVVKVNAYLTNIGNLPILRDVRSKYIVGAPPASTALEISKLAQPEALLEIEMVAVMTMT